MSNCFLVNKGGQNIDHISEYLSRLPSFERGFSESIISPEKRFEYVFSRAILREILATYLQGEPIISIGDQGKPYLQNSTLQFNLSHSNEWVLIGVSDTHPIGVDIEEIKPIPDWKVIEEIGASQLGFSNMGFSAPSDLIDFYQQWTQREALLKACGYGLTPPTSLIDSTESKGFTSHHQIIDRSYSMSAVILAPGATLNCLMLELNS